MSKINSFTNHLGQVWDLSDVVSIDNTAIQNYEWSFNTDNNAISNFIKKPISRNIDLIFSSPVALAQRDAIFELIEVDVLAEIPGELSVNGYVMKCYLHGINNKEAMLDNYMKFSVMLASDNPVWQKETATTFGIVEASESVGAFDFPFDFPFGFTKTFSAQALENTSFMDGSFQITIQGPVVNPIVTIGNNTYSIFTSLEASEFLTITSIGDGVNAIKTIVKTAPTGVETNVFDKRNKAYNNFAKITPGINLVAWSGLFAFEVRLIEERSEPKWSL